MDGYDFVWKLFVYGLYGLCGFVWIVWIVMVLYEFVWVLVCSISRV